jgi:biopolymer transport protein ExbD
MKEKIFSVRGNIIEHDHKENDDPERVGNLPIEERLKKAKELQEEPEESMISGIEKKELSPEQRKVRLEKLKEYLENLKQNKEVPFIIKGAEEEEIEKVKAEIEKLEE